MNMPTQAAIFGGSNYSFSGSRKQLFPCSMPEGQSKKIQRNNICPEENVSCGAANIWVARTYHATLVPRRDLLICPTDRYLFTIALEDADVAFSDERRTVFCGPMKAGTVLVSGPAQQITAASNGPCDFLHLSVLKAFLAEQSAMAGFGPPSRRRDLNGLVAHDALIEQAGRLLVAGPNGWPRTYPEILSHLIVTRLLRLLPRPAPSAALPLWRLKKVLHYIESDIAAPLRLRDLAAAAGLSRMHFAAQFKAATGSSPHEYVLSRRIDHAKKLIDRPGISLVQVALDVGFQSQAHFCTIFKRLTGATPSAWRRNRINRLANNFDIVERMSLQRDRCDGSETAPLLWPIFDRKSRVALNSQFAASS